MGRYFKVQTKSFPTDSVAMQFDGTFLGAKDVRSFVGEDSFLAREPYTMRKVIDNTPLYIHINSIDNVSKVEKGDYIIKTDKKIMVVSEKQFEQTFIEVEKLN